MNLEHLYVDKVQHIKVKGVDEYGEPDLQDTQEIRGRIEAVETVEIGQNIKNTRALEFMTAYKGINTGDYIDGGVVVKVQPLKDTQGNVNNYYIEIE